MNISEINMSASDIKLKLQVHIASLFIGIKETKGNKGQIIEKFQKAVDGVASGEPWCMSFAQYCAMQADELFKYVFDGVCESEPMALFKTEHVLTCWNKSPKVCRIEKPQVGAWVIWSHYDAKGKETGAGHIEIITEILNENLLKIIGGNTSGPSDDVVREGDGVWKKTRDLRYHYGSMRFKGLLLPWK